MSTTATRCTCCGDSCGKVPTFDVILGTLCDDCTEGVRNGVANLRKAGVSRLYAGPCGDNDKQEGEP